MIELSRISAPCAWTGSDLAHSDRWVRELGAREIAELDAALGLVEVRGLAWHEITAKDFPLPGLRGLINDIRHELENGCGLTKLRGFPVSGYDEDQRRKLYYGFGRHVGTPVYQNRCGQLMRVIRDEGAGVGRRYGQIDGGQTPDENRFCHPTPAP